MNGYAVRKLAEYDREIERMDKMAAEFEDEMEKARQTLRDAPKKLLSCQLRSKKLREERTEFARYAKSLRS